jgi:hypothetical protein
MQLILGLFNEAFFVNGDGIQIQKVAANVLNKQLWTINKGWSSSLGLCQEA